MANEIIHVFEFNGRAIIDQHDKNDISYREIVFKFNNQSYKISEEIQTEISRTLPPSVMVQTQIQFFDGSIAWTGIVTILDWMARLAGAAELVGILNVIIRSAIERVMRRWLLGWLDMRGNMSIQVEVIPQNIGTSKIAKKYDIFRRLFFITVLNTLLLLIVIVVQIVLR